jgi:N-acetyl-gamma-glutamyl-phosphate reductase / acetylglutamate kinase
VFGVSGYSGAGTSGGQNPKIPPETLAGGIQPYALTDHIHEREAGHHLSRLAGRDVTVAFIPTVAPWFQGIISAVSVPLNKTLRASDVRQLYQEKYDGEKLVEIVTGVPEIKDIAGKNGFKAGGFQVHSSGKRVVVVVRSFSLSGSMSNG